MGQNWVKRQKYLGQGRDNIFVFVFLLLLRHASQIQNLLQMETLKLQMSMIRQQRSSPYENRVLIY